MRRWSVRNLRVMCPLLILFISAIRDFWSLWKACIGGGLGGAGWAPDWEGVGSVSGFRMLNLFDVGIGDVGGFWIIVGLFGILISVGVAPVCTFCSVQLFYLLPRQWRI